jgi:UDP-glucose 4-epimerase
MNLKNILLTGGAGYIGSHTAVVLMQSGYRVIIYDNLSNSNEGIVKGIEQITKKSPDFIRGDVRDTAGLTKVLEQNQIDAVIHLAGLKAVGESVLMPINYYANNVQGSISLLQAMQCVGVSQLVFSSSATVYGDPQYLPVNELHPLNPTNPYGRNKQQVEQLLADVVSSDNCKWGIICLRYFNPVGAHESALIGELPQGTPNNLMPYIARVASGKETKLNIYGNDYATSDGTGVRDYIHVMDLAEGHLAALDYVKNHSGIRFINLGNGIGYSVLEMVGKFQEVSNKLVTHQVVDRRSGDIASCYADPTVAKNLLGWSAKRDINEMCSSAWRWQNNIDKI